MKGFQIQQKGERRISAALRIMLVIFLLAVQIALVVAISYFMQEYLALAYAVVQVAALFLAIHIYNEPGELSYKLIWFILLLLAPPVGMILWFLWGGAAQKRHLPQNGKRVPDEPESVRKRSALAVERLTRQLPGWSRTANYLCRRDFQLYQDTRVTYLFPVPAGRSPGGPARTYRAGKEGRALHLSGIFHSGRRPALVRA